MPSYLEHQSSQDEVKDQMRQYIADHFECHGVPVRLKEGGDASEYPHFSNIALVEYFGAIKNSLMPVVSNWCWEEYLTEDAENQDGISELGPGVSMEFFQGGDHNLDSGYQEVSMYEGTDCYHLS